jgi:periplasmic copper chaperone A
MTRQSISPLRLARALIVVAVMAVVVIAGTGTAHAHVTAQLVDVADDGTATVTFRFDHGCDGQATASLRIELPDQAADVAAAGDVEGWQFGASDTEFGWTGGPVSDGEEASFTATMRVWGAEGDTIWFPAVQGCPPTSEEAWIAIPQPGESEPSNVAPSIVLPRTIEAPATTTTVEPTTTSSTASVTTTTFPNVAITEEGSPQNNVGLVVGGIAVGAIVVGAIVLYLRHRRPPPPI